MAFVAFRVVIFGLFTFRVVILPFVWNLILVCGMS